MATQAPPENPVETLKQWLLNDWKGALRPTEVMAVRGEDADGRDAWYFEIVLPDPLDETWDAAELSRLQHGVRDKALEVGLAYPWYVIPRTKDDETPEDEEDLPDDSD